MSTQHKLFKLTPSVVNEAIELVEPYVSGLYQPKFHTLIGLFRLLDHAAGCSEYSTYHLHSELLRLCEL